jgi:hypothetical protein
MEVRTVGGMGFPDYAGGSIVNLVSSMVVALSGVPTGYAPLRLLPPDRLHAARNLILLVLDGLGYTYLQRDGNGGRLHQHLIGPIDSVAPPTTATAIPSFLTGLPPAVHGFTGWYTWLRELGCVTAVLPFVTRHGALSLEPGGIGPQQLSGAVPLFERLAVVSHVVTPRHIAYSAFNRAFSSGARIHPYTDLSGFFRVIGKLVRKSRQPQYIYAYWPQLDTLAHEHGLADARIAQHFAVLDQAFGRFMDDIVGSETAVIVTADHGFVDVPRDGQIQLSEHPLLEQCLVLPLCGEPRFAYCYVHPAKRRQFEDYVTNELADKTQLFTGGELIECGLFGPGECHPSLQDRVGHYVLAMRDNYVLKDRLPGEKPFRQVGVHGGLSAAELKVPLVFAEV